MQPRLSSQRCATVGEEETSVGRGACVYPSGKTCTNSEILKFLTSILESDVFKAIALITGDDVYIEKVYTRYLARNFNFNTVLHESNFLKFTMNHHSAQLVPRTRSNTRHYES